MAGLVDAGAFEEATQTIESYLAKPPSQAARARALIELVAVLRQSGRETTELHKKLDEASSLATGFDRGHLAFERGMLWLRDGRLDEAERALRDATDIIEKTIGQVDPFYWIAVSTWSMALSNLGRHEEARQRLESIQDRIRHEGAGDDEIYFHVVWHLGDVYAKLGMFPEAERILRERIRVLGNRAGASDAYLCLSIVLRSAKKLQEADEAARQALNLAKLHHGGTSAELASAYHEHGMVLKAAGRYGEATEAYRRSLEILEERHVVNDHNYVMTKWMLARALENLGNLKDAEHQLRQSLAIVDACLGGDKYADYWGIRRDVGITLERQGDYDGAQAHFRQMIRTLDAEQAPNDQVLLIALQDLLFCLNTGGSADPKEIEFIARRQLTVTQRAYGVEDESRLQPLNNLACALGAQRRFDEAERSLSEAMEIGRKFRGEGGVEGELLHSHVVLTQLKLWQGKEDATDSAKVALDLLERTIKPSDPNYNATRQFLDDVIDDNVAEQDNAKADGEDGGSDPS